MMAFTGVRPRGSSIPGRHQQPRTRPVPSNVVCKFWAQGRCSRRPCPFLHGTDPPQPFHGVSRRPPEESDIRGRLRFPRENLVWKNSSAAPHLVTATTSPPPPKKTKMDEEKKTDTNGCLSPSKKMKCSNEEKKIESPAISEAANAPLNQPNCRFKATASLPPPANGCISPSKKMKCSNEEKNIKSPAISETADAPLDKPNCSFKATGSVPPPANGCISPSKKMKSSNEEKKVESPAVYDAAETLRDKPNCSFKATVDGCSRPPKRMKSSDEEKEIESPVVSKVVDATLDKADFNFKTTDAVDPALPGKDLAVAETKTNLVVETPLDTATQDAPELSPRKTEAPPPLSAKFMSFLCGGDTRKITGIATPRDLDKFFSSSDDGKICVWRNLVDGQQEQKPEQVIQLRSPVSCLITEGICVFAGARDGVHVCNILSKAGLFLPIPAGGVTSLAASNVVLFAGLDDGRILAWKMIANHVGLGKQNDVQFQPAACLSGHTSAVTCLAVRGINLFSGGKDGSIRAWNVTSLEVVKELDVPLAAHEGDVTSLIFWTDYLLSASLDAKIKVWGSKYVENTLVGLQQIYIHQEQLGILSLGATDDGAKGPVLLCSLSDGTVRLYHLPTFLERGAIQCTSQAVTIHPVLSGGFIGEVSGLFRFWSFSTGA